MTIEEVKYKLRDRNVKFVAEQIGVHYNTLYKLIKGYSGVNHTTYLKLVKYLES